MILGDVIDADADLPVEREANDIFAHAGTAGEYVEDLICEIICQVLYDDADVRTADESRQSAAATQR